MLCMLQAGQLPLSTEAETEGTVIGATARGRSIKLPSRFADTAAPVAAASIAAHTLCDNASQQAGADVDLVDAASRSAKRARDDCASATAFENAEEASTGQVKRRKKCTTRSEPEQCFARL